MGHNLGNNYWLSCNSLVLPNTEFTVTGDNCVRPAPPAPPRPAPSHSDDTDHFTGLLHKFGTVVFTQQRLQQEKAV